MLSSAFADWLLTALASIPVPAIEGRPIVYDGIS